VSEYEATAEQANEKHCVPDKLVELRDKIAQLVEDETRQPTKRLERDHACGIRGMLYGQDIHIVLFQHVDRPWAKKGKRK